MSKVMKKAGVLLLAILLCVSAFGVLAGTFGGRKTSNVRALAADPEKEGTTVKVEYSIPKEAQVGGSLPAGTVINRGISLFNWVGDGNTGLKPGYKLAYEVYSPTPVQGLGFFGGAEQGGTWKSWDKMFTTEADQNGITGQSHADLTDYIGNGWFDREIEFGKYLTVENGGLASSHWVSMLETKSPVPYETLTVYYRNVRILNEKDEIENYCFYKGKTSDKYAMSAYNFPTKLKECDKPEDNYMYAPPEGDPATVVVTEGDDDNLRRIKTTIEYVDGGIAPATMSFEKPVQGINSAIDFQTIVKKDGATLNEVKVYSLTDEGAIKAEIAVDNFTINVPDMGKYRVELKATKNNLESNAVLYLWTVDPAVPFIFEADTDVIQTVYKDKESILLPKISAYYKNQLYPIVPTVTFNGGAITLSETADGFTFTPAEYGDYVVTYTYTDPDNSAKTVSTAPKTIRVGVLSVDLSGLESITKEDGNVMGVGYIGTAYDLSKALFKDPKNGNTAYEVKVFKGAAEQEVTKGEGATAFSFLTDVAGEYKAVFSAQNFMGETVEKEFNITINAIEGMVTKLKVYVPKELRAAGIRKTAEIRVFGWLEGEALTPRQTINYSIYMPKPISGVGFVDFLGNNTGSAGWGKYSAANGGLTGTEKDKAGIDFKPSADLTSKLLENGTPVWYTRSLPVPTAYSQAGGMCDMLLAIDTTDAVDEFIEIYVKDIYFMGDDGTKTVYYNGEQLTQAPSVFAANNPPTPGGYSLTAEKVEADNNAIKVTIGVPETHRAAGVAKEATVRLFGWAQKAGIPGSGKLSYDIKMDNPIAGVGYLNLYGDNMSSIGWGQLIPENAQDQNGLALSAATDLSAKLGSYYTREIAYNVGAAKESIADAFLKINTTAATGDKIVIYINNIKFIDSDNATTVYYSGTELALAAAIASSNINASELPDPDNYAVTGGSTYADGPMLYKLNLPKDGIIEAAKPYTLSDKLAYDYIKREFVDYTVTVTNPKNQAVTVTGKTFTPTIKGEYRVKITATNSSGTLSQVFVLTAEDNVKPVIADMTMPSNAEVGKEVKLTLPTVTDNASAAGDIMVKITVLDPDGNTVELTNNSFTPAKEGKYTVKILAIDEADNSETRTFEFNVAKKSGCGSGCGGGNASANAAMLLSVVAILGGFVLIRKMTM